MAEYSSRYDVGSLESTERRFSDWALVKRLLKDYMMHHRTLVLIVGLLILAKALFILAGPYIYKVSIDHFIRQTPNADGKWLADIIRSLAMVFSGGGPLGNLQILLSWTSLCHRWSDALDCNGVTGISC